MLLFQGAHLGNFSSRALPVMRRTLLFTLSETKSHWKVFSREETLSDYQDDCNYVDNKQKYGGSGNGKTEDK